ncbi:MAG: hypothetical protein K9K38_17215 [Rhodoferax sp.]|nr:hypothetical protein [Rhodoferax sp.]MCF8211119.1 hypothetical protein [Rhodoferax sp.]
MTENPLSHPATVDLTGTASIAAMAAREILVWDPDTYAANLALHIRSDRVPLDVQRERLAQLSTIGVSAGKASAQELARHALLLDALFAKFAHASAELLDANSVRNAVASERYLGMAVKAQRAALATLSALKILRDSEQSRPEIADGLIRPK